MVHFSLYCPSNHSAEFVFNKDYIKISDFYHDSSFTFNFISFNVQTNIQLLNSISKTVKTFNHKNHDETVMQ